MRSLILIQERDGQKVVSARDLHAFLEVGRDFTTWIKSRIEKYELVNGQDFSPVSVRSTGGRPAADYALTIDTAKELSMVENNDKGKQARRYFIECEKVARQNSQLPDFANPAAAARAWADKEEQRQIAEGRVKQLTAEIESNAPAVATYNLAIASGGSLSMEETAKILHFANMGRNNLFKFLRDSKILNSDNIPYQRFVNSGYFKVVEKPYSNERRKDVGKQTRVLQRGVTFIREKLEVAGKVNIPQSRNRPVVQIRTGMDVN